MDETRPRHQALLSVYGGDVWHGTAVGAGIIWSRAIEYPGGGFRFSDDRADHRGNEEAAAEREKEWEQHRRRRAPGMKHHLRIEAIIDAPNWLIALIFILVSAINLIWVGTYVW